MKKSELKKIIHECLCECIGNIKLESVKNPKSKRIVESTDIDNEDLVTEFLDSSKICKDSFDDIVTFLDEFGDDAEAGIQDYYDADNFIKEEIPTATAWYTLWDDDSEELVWNILAFTPDKKCYVIQGISHGYWRFIIEDNADIVRDFLDEFTEMHPEYFSYTPSV